MRTSGWPSGSRSTGGELRAVAYRMLGSLSEADDAVQEAWLRLARTDVSGVENLGAWLTTVVGRVCLGMLRSRTTRREDPLGPHVPDPVITPAEDSEPEQHAVLADSVGLALLVVLDMLPPAERLAFVLHNMFAVPFDQIAAILGRSEAAARQLARRARRRVQGAERPTGCFGDRTGRRGRGWAGAHVRRVRPSGPARPGQRRRRRPGHRRWPVSVMGFIVAGGKITAIDALADPDRLAQLDLGALDD